MLTANEPHRKSWIEVESNSDFPIQNIPFGVFIPNDDFTTIGTRIGNTAIDLSAMQQLGYFSDIDELPEDVFLQDTLNDFITHGRPMWRKVRNRIADIFDVENVIGSDNDDFIEGDGNANLLEGGAGNDVPEDVNQYATDYLWNEVLLPDNLLNILARFVHLEIEDKEDWEGRKYKKEKGIFKKSSKVTVGDYRGFLKQKHDSYAKYNDTFSQTWHIKDASSVVPTKVCQEYSEFETSVASQNEPIYTLVAMLPCEYLWAWIADQLKSYTSGNIYASWITGNDYFDGAYAMGNFLSAYQKNHSIDENLAMQIYQKAIEFEFQNFKTAM